MNNIIKEELNKFKLLMNYNTKITLTENLIKTSYNNTERILISEQPLKTFLKSLFGLADNVKIGSGIGSADEIITALKRTNSPAYKNAVNLFDDAIVKGAGFNTADELISAMALGTLTKPQISGVAKNLLKQGKVTGSMRMALTDTAADLAFKDPRYMGKSGKQVKKMLTGKGYDEAISNEIATNFTVKNLKAKKIPIGPDDAKTAIDNVPNVPKKATTWQSLKKWGLGAGLTIGAIAIIYSLTNEEELVSSEDGKKTDTTPKPINPGQSRYRNCDNEGKYTKGCRTKPEGPIGQVQACLGGLVVDGKFWEKTQAALEDAGYPNGFTIEEIKTICGNQTKPEEVKPLPPDDEVSDVNNA